ncbi:MAG: 2-C-methyl-D-erythritol 2,4-cyclodiphosphate synthase [Vicinamibacterales bacterium]
MSTLPAQLTRVDATAARLTQVCGGPRVVAAGMTDGVTPGVASALIAAGGQGTRLGSDTGSVPRLGGRSILLRTIERFCRPPGRVGGGGVVAGRPRGRGGGRHPAAGLAAGRCVPGGARRQDSVARAFEAARPEVTLLAIHDAARPFVSAGLIARRRCGPRARRGHRRAACPRHGQAGGRHAAAAARPIAATLPRDDIFLAQTPQVFTREVLAHALPGAATTGVDASDEALLAEQTGVPVFVIAGEPGNVKITTAEDLEAARQRVERSADLPFRVGTGYDLHRLVDGRPLLLGGVLIPFDKGLDGHSDADIVCHAVTDAVLGAAAAGDIGRLFPDTDPRWKGADSLALLRGAVAHLGAAGYRVSNVDVTVIAQRPKLLPYLDAMCRNLADALGVDTAAVSIKGKTNEQVDSMGRGESMACHAVALVARAHIDD